MDPIRVRDLLSNMNGPTKTRLRKLLPKCDLPDSGSIKYPNAILSVLPNTQKYSLLGFVAEEMLRYPVADISLDTLAIAMKKWYPEYTDLLHKKVVKSATTQRFLNHITSTRAKMDLVIKGTFVVDTTVSFGSVEGHPDAQTETQIFEVKMTGQLQKNWKDFLDQVFAYAALCQTATELFLVLPMQELVWSYNLSDWPKAKREQFRDLLQEVAVKRQTAPKNTDISTNIFRLQYNIGNHVHKGTHLHETIEQLGTISFPLQLFLGSSLSSKLNMKDSELAQASAAMMKTTLQLFVHSPYIINLCADPKEKDDYGTTLLKKNLQYGSIVGCKGVVVHVGKYTKQDPVVALERMRTNMLRALESATPDCPLLLETPAGQGTETLVGREEFVAFVANFKDPRIGICVDTCHVFACGHDPLQYIEYITQTHPGLLKLVHYNDSATPCGSCLDRHALFGTGHIGMEKMTQIAQHCHQWNCPMVIE